MSLDDLPWEPIIRLVAFACVFAPMALWELWAPRRKLSIGRGRRWPNNLAIVVIDTVLMRLLIPTAAVGVALIASGYGFGLFNLTSWPLTVEALLGFLILDLVIWGQHVMFHRVPWLWRLHRMHHADLDIDVSTGLRFHPIEILLSMLIKMATVALFGIPAVAVILFEVVLNATSIFSHSNVRMPAWLDRVLRLVVVTPDMHRVHHSIDPSETNSNYGFNMPWWDWLFRTYRAAPKAGHDGMTIGLPIFRDLGELRLDRLLTQPFRNDRAKP
jgi:sterol desaturase/sphingolipid hydroxylase (fatty acid hydroxylase superfamily)